MSERAGFCGLGIMGSRMAANLRSAGYELSVWTRTGGKAQEWAHKHRAKAFSTPAEVAAWSDVVITMVVDGVQVESVLLCETGAAEGAHEDSLFVDMSTIGPLWARKVGDSLGERGIGFVDAPVTGSSPKAEDGTLTIMAGGEPTHYERALPLFEAMGSVVVHAGPVGDGQMIKLINNTLAAINTAAVAQALRLADASEVDHEALETVIASGSGGSAMFDLKAAPMRAGNYTTLFKLEHMLKDVRLYLDEAERAGAPSGLARSAEALLARATELGFGEQDFAALIEALDSED